jgi:hypothetical protein
LAVVNGTLQLLATDEQYGISLDDLISEPSTKKVHILAVDRWGIKGLYDVQDADVTRRFLRKGKGIRWKDDMIYR